MGGRFLFGLATGLVLGAAALVAVSLVSPLPGASEGAGPAGGGTAEPIAETPAEPAGNGTGDGASAPAESLPAESVPDESLPAGSVPSGSLPGESGEAIPAAPHAGLIDLPGMSHPAGLDLGPGALPGEAPGTGSAPGVAQAPGLPGPSSAEGAPAPAVPPAQAPELSPAAAPSAPATRTAQGEAVPPVAPGADSPAAGGGRADAPAGPPPEDAPQAGQDPGPGPAEAAAEPAAPGAAQDGAAQEGSPDALPGTLPEESSEAAAETSQGAPDEETPGEGTTGAVPDSTPATAPESAPDSPAEATPEPSPDALPEPSPEPSPEESTDAPVDGSADEPSGEAPPAPEVRRIAIGEGAATLPPAPSLIAPEAGGGSNAGLPQIGEQPAAGSGPALTTEEAGTEPAARPLDRYARPFDNPDGKPVLAILLIDTGESGLDRAALAALPFPVSFALDPLDPEAPAHAAIYRAAGQEVVMLATGFPRGAQASDVEVALAAMEHALPETVAVMDLPERRFQGDRPLASLVVPAVAASGRGLLSWDEGLNAAAQVAAREHAPAAVIFRNLDGDGEGAPAIARYLDRAVFKAAQEGMVLVAGHTRPETVAALLEWSVGARAALVALAPASAAMAGEGGG